MELHKSKRFWNAMIAIVVILFSSVIPELEEHLSTIAPTVIIIIGILIGGYSHEDAQAAKHQTKV